MVAFIASPLTLPRLNVQETKMCLGAVLGAEERQAARAAQEPGLSGNRPPPLPHPPPKTYKQIIK